MTTWSQQKPPPRVLGKTVVGSSRFHVPPPSLLTSTDQLNDIITTSRLESAPLMSAALVRLRVTVLPPPYAGKSIFASSAFETSAAGGSSFSARGFRVS